MGRIVLVSVLLIAVIAVITTPFQYSARMHEDLAAYADTLEKSEMSVASRKALVSFAKGQVRWGTFSFMVLGAAYALSVGALLTLLRPRKLGKEEAYNQTRDAAAKE